MLLDETYHYTLHRRGRFLTAAFKRPHRVLSTCRINGRLREDLTHIANHQSCEGVGHVARHHSVMGLGPDAGHCDRWRARQRHPRRRSGRLARTSGRQRAGRTPGG